MGSTPGDAVGLTRPATDAIVGQTRLNRHNIPRKQAFPQIACHQLTEADPPDRMAVFAA